MKTIAKSKTNFKKALSIIALCVGLNGLLTAQCNASFTYTTDSTDIYLTSTSTGTTSAYQFYTWYLYTASSGATPIVQSGSPTASFGSLYNGTYTVTLIFGDSLPNCSSISSQTMSITNGQNPPPSPSCSASFTYTSSSSSISATSTSTGTTSTTAYSWNLINASNTFLIGGTSYVFNSLYNGTYTLSLSISDSLGCSNTGPFQTITISGGQDAPACVSSFTYATGSAGAVNYTNTSPSDPYNNTYYIWNFGDGATVSTTNPTHTYYYNGTYVVSLNVNNNTSGCSTSSTQTITITNGQSAPSCNANFTYTLGVTGQSNFTSQYTGTSPTTSYYWDFGNGGYSQAKNPSYTYPYNGTYNVTLYVTDSVNNYCSSNTTQTLAITNTAPQPCAPTVSFYMHKDSLNPQPGIWEISPNYSSQVSHAIWFWGDGTYTIGLYPGHTYATAGQYSVCVTVYAACGDSSTTCQNDSLYRLAATNSMIQVTVLDNATTGIKTNIEETAQIVLYPNPSAGLFTLNLNNVSANVSNVQINITTILGEAIYNLQERINNTSLYKEIDLQNMANGAYFMKVSIGDKTYTNKIIINK